MDRIAAVFDVDRHVFDGVAAIPEIERAPDFRLADGDLLARRHKIQRHGPDADQLRVLRQENVVLFVILGAGVRRRDRHVVGQVIRENIIGPGVHVDRLFAGAAAPPATCAPWWGPHNTPWGSPARRPARASRPRSRWSSP